MRCLTSVLLACALMVPSAAFAADRSYVSGNFMFNLQGVKTGFVRSVDGGGIKSEVIADGQSADYYVAKHIGQPKYQDFEMQIGFSMTRAVSEWIESSWSSAPLRKDGSIIAADFNLNAKSEREFFNALVTETAIPACDGSSKDPAYMTLKFAPEYTRYKKASGKVKAEQIDSKNQKTWLPSNFRLELQGLDCKRVNKIDSFTIKQTVARDPVCDDCELQIEPAKIEFPNLKVRMDEATNQSWLDYAEDFAASLKDGKPDERDGTLDLLDTDGATVLTRVSLHRCGITALRPSQASASGALETLAELYCQRMSINFPRTGIVKE